MIIRSCIIMFALLLSVEGFISGVRLAWHGLKAVPCVPGTVSLRCCVCVVCSYRFRMRALRPTCNMSRSC